MVKSSEVKDTILDIVKRALAEDIGDGDVTSACTVPENTRAAGRMIAKEAGVVAGLEVAGTVFAAVDKMINFVPVIQDGAVVAKGDLIARINGPARSILEAERVALNFLQRMSGIATLTNKFVKAVEGTSAVILDTRKTAPGLRLTDKWAVRLGGGQNHRIGLYDMVMIKDNHIAAVGSITKAVAQVKEKDERKRSIEVEVKNLKELREALGLKIDRIMLDNMSLEVMKQAVKLTDGRIPLEASGNVNPDTVAGIAATGVDYISVGMLTHSVKALDISLLLD
ncbi:MAG: carboxylating nicotinate-nucleotide diphosphorylase [Calditrichaceae bacterium]